MKKEELLKFVKKLNFNQIWKLSEIGCQTKKKLVWLFFKEILMIFQNQIVILKAYLQHGPINTHNETNLILKWNWDFGQKKKMYEYLNYFRKAFKKTFMNFQTHLKDKAKGVSRSTELSTFLPESLIVHEQSNSWTLGLTERASNV